MIAAQGVAAFQVSQSPSTPLINSHQQRLIELLPPSWSEKARTLKVNPRLIDYEPITKIKHIKANVISTKES